MEKFLLIQKMYRVRWMHSFLQTGKIAGKPRSAGSDDGAVEEKGGSIYIGGACVYGAVRKEVTPGKLRSAFRILGFDGMVEVALLRTY